MDEDDKDLLLGGDFEEPTEDDMLDEENEEDLSDSQGESDTAIPDETGEPEET